MRIVGFTFGLGIWAALAVMPIGAHAQEARETVFLPFLSQSSPHCVPVADVKRLGAAVDLSPEQYRFAQGLYTFIPPVSKALPTGDRGMIVGAADGTAIILLVDGDKSCARFLAPDFVLKMLNDIKTGKVWHTGKPA